MNLLKAGDIIELGIGHSVYADVPEHFVYSNRKGSFELIHAAVDIEGELRYLAGRYVVTHTTVDGGGLSHDGAFPNGHHVFCVNLDSDRLVDFYQTGCFSAMIKNIEPVGRAKQSWKEAS